MYVAKFLRPLVALGITAAVAVGSAAPLAAGEMGGDAAEVEREILVQTVPSQAPDHDLYLYRVTVPPGAQLPAHTHPGTQAAHIQSGTLTYQVLSGSAVVVRAAQGDKAATPETVTAPVTVKLRKGDAVIENPQLVHQARNDGKRPVVILLSSLLTKGAPLSEPVG